jgi:hypothetical protein
MRTKHNRLARENRFYGILSSVRGEAFPDEHHSSDAVPALKFTSRIEKHAIRIYRAACVRFAGKRHAQRHCGQVRPDFLEPFDMTRSDEQPQRRELLAQPKKNPDQDFFFTTVRTATEENE